MFDPTTERTCGKTAKQVRTILAARQIKLSLQPLLEKLTAYLRGEG